MRRPIIGQAECPPQNEIRLPSVIISTMARFTLVVALLGALPAAAQEGALDVLDGETLFEGGWLFTLGIEQERRKGLLDGSDSVSDPLDREQTEQSMVLSAHYGLRYDLQISAILPYVRRELTLDDPAGPDRLAGEGAGDFTATAKWRFYRWDEPHRVLNVALIGGLEFPTGATDERDGGTRLPAGLQPGSGSWDPLLGLGATYEPYRWRFNAFVVYKVNGEGARDFNEGEEFHAEVAVGNRFWLEPYPGPFMRFDVMLRYRHTGQSTAGGRAVNDSGGDLWNVGANLAFRPQPTIDLQVAVEVPVAESVHGTQLEQDYSVFVVFGFRI